MKETNIEFTTKAIELKTGGQFKIIEKSSTHERDGKEVAQSVFYRHELLDGEGKQQDGVSVSENFDYTIEASISTSSYSSLTVEEALNYAKELTHRANVYAEISELIEGKTLQELFNSAQ